jgi:hypothetical protein
MSRARPATESRNQSLRTPERQAQIEAWRAAILGHGRLMLPRLRGLAYPDLHALIQSADKYLAQYPLHQSGDMTFEMPLWGRRMAGAELVALVVFGLWVYMGEDAPLAKVQEQAEQ